MRNPCALNYVGHFDCSSYTLGVWGSLHRCKNRPSFLSSGYFPPSSGYKTLWFLEAAKWSNPKPYTLSSEAPTGAQEGNAAGWEEPLGGHMKYAECLSAMSLESAAKTP